MRYAPDGGQDNPSFYIQFFCNDLTESDGRAQEPIEHPARANPQGQVQGCRKAIKQFICADQ